jgi:hypothetical protein
MSLIIPSSSEIPVSPPSDALCFGARIVAPLCGISMLLAIWAALDTNPLSVLGEALESAAETFGQATTNARASAKVAAKKVRKTFGTGVYKTAYGISYGLVYSAVFVTELLPEDNVLRRGFEEGAEAALDAAASRRLEISATRTRSVETRKKPAVRASSPVKTSKARTAAKPRKALA